MIYVVCSPDSFTAEGEESLEKKNARTVYCYPNLVYSNVCF